MHALWSSQVDLLVGPKRFWNQIDALGGLRIGHLSCDAKLALTGCPVGAACVPFTATWGCATAVSRQVEDDWAAVGHAPRRDTHVCHAQGDAIGFDVREKIAHLRQVHPECITGTHGQECIALSNACVDG